MKVAVAQISSELGNVPANIAKVERFCERAREDGAALVVFPEMIDTGYAMAAVREHATPWTEGAVPALRAIAQQLSIAIISGVSEREGACIYNSQVFIDDAGEIAGRYRKTHLFKPAPIAEHTCFTCGDELAAFEFSALRLGLSICYDLRFPEVYRRLAVEEKTDVFILSSAWPFPRVEHFRVLATARAIENQSYMVVANRVGTDNGVTFCGNSVIIDPSGVVLASASADAEEIIFAEVSGDSIHAVRERMSVFADRRQELYRSHEFAR
jgi:predicted amidohydrolase